MMLKLRDFFHLAQVDELVAQLVQEKSGLMVVSGPDMRTLGEEAWGSGLLTSGRSGIFNILIQEILEANPKARAIIVSQDKSSARLGKELRRRLKLSLVEPPISYTQQIHAAMGSRPDLLVIDQLNRMTLPLAFKAARSGLWVLSQLDSILWGRAVAQQFVDMGVKAEELQALRWVVGVQRHATLCKECRLPARPEATLWDQLKRRFPELTPDLERLQALSDQERIVFYKPGKCVKCKESGRLGDVTTFDIHRFNRDGSDPFAGSALIPIESYLLYLAEKALVPLEDLLYFESGLLRNTYNLLYNRELELSESTSKLQRKLLELETANRVLQQRTEAVFSLQEMGQALISSSNLQELAARVCRYAGQICGANRSILYYLRSGEGGQAWAEVLAVSGWDTSLVSQKIEALMVFPQSLGTHALPYRGLPPGTSKYSHVEAESESLSNGLLVPMLAQDSLVGMMIVHAAGKEHFPPGEVALLQTFANQAALAVQRAGLIDDLRQKIHLLEAAQAELVVKERMQRELELAREVQQSVLPRTFPQVGSYEFAVRNQAALQLGGDFYDIFKLDEDHFGVLIADVSDKGMPAAVYMAMARSLLLAETHRENSPGKVLRNVNHLLRELGEPNMFVSVFYGMVDIHAHRLTYARAGHDRPVLVRTGELIHLPGSGAVLGPLDEEHLNLSEEYLELQSGDRLVLYTDGLTDAVDGEEELFGLHRLENALREFGNLAAAEMCEVVFAAIAEFQGESEQYDDMTMIVVEVK
jgi:serine phosphatase RsbU (regulator of sigma subunit)